ncbi:hypothetical protein H9Q10_09500 [Eikenella sp. S3360]|uniref:Lipoprotein n=1 Tax=Eikenella glucosivorans TaxID=2766967 RepID=A0ABS0NC96_9NEIS|nr:hypothetical protein [Eikenella glucosivorans]MBH5329899.1 hypothetical protein [Eikenella glucosivorans]
MQPYPPPSHPAHNLLRLSLLAGAVFLFAGCSLSSQLTRSMSKSIGKPFSEVVREHGQRPVFGPTRESNNRYRYTYKYYRTRYAGTENLGTYNNPGIGTGRTTYFAHVCYARDLIQTYWTDANGIVVDGTWHLSREWRIDCNER